MSALRVPGRIGRLPFPGGEALNIRTVTIHSIHLRGPAASSGNKNNLISGLGIDLRLHFDGTGIGEAADAGAVGVGHVNLRKTACG